MAVITAIELFSHPLRLPSGIQVKTVAKEGRIIDIIDSYWISHLTTLEELRKTILNTANLETETIDDFEREANKLFIAMNEDIKNEIITYSIIPNMPFGSYVIKSSIDDEEVKML